MNFLVLLCWFLLNLISVSSAWKFKNLFKNLFFRSKSSVPTLDHVREREPVVLEDKACYNDLISNFEMIQKIGFGAIGSVFMVRKRFTSELYAIKVVERRIIEISDSGKYLSRELKVLSVINSPFVVKYYGRIYDERLVGFILEPCVLGNLKTYIDDKKVFLFNQG